MKNSKRSTQIEIESSAKRRVVTSLVLSIFLSGSVVFFIPFAFSGPSGGNYKHLLSEIHCVIEKAFYYDQSLFVTLTFGIIAAAIALYAVAGSNRIGSRGADAVEFEVLGVHVSWINFVLSVIFGMLLCAELSTIVYAGFRLGPAYVFTSNLMGFFICGFLAGFHVRGDYLKGKSIRESYEILEWLRAKERVPQLGARFKPDVFMVFFHGLLSLGFTLIGALSLLMNGMELDGLFAVMLFDLIYGFVLAYILYQLYLYKWDNRASGKVSLNLMRFASSLTVILIIFSQITLSTHFFEIEYLGDLLAVVFVWTSVVLLPLVFPKISSRYEQVILNRQAVQVKSRIESTRRFIERTSDSLRIAADPV